MTDKPKLYVYGGSSFNDFREATTAELVGVVRHLPNVEERWWCEAWENFAGVSEPCEAGSTHDAPDFNCRWVLVVPLGGDDT